jgi:hypothetical protein
MSSASKRFAPVTPSSLRMTGSHTSAPSSPGGIPSTLPTPSSVPAPSRGRFRVGVPRPGARAIGLLFLAVASLPAGAVAQAIPSPRDVFGWEMGERFADARQVVRYFDTLASASPLVTVERYGTSNQGRELVQAIIASPAHMARLDAILQANEELTDPDLPEARAREIAASNPAVLFFTYGIHGNESSSSEAAMWTAWDLATGDPSVAGVLDSVVVVMDPVANPDGRDRYVEWFRNAMGAEPDPDPAAREHREPWPGGRTNHYLFDLNRDWAWMSQKETRVRLATWSRWNPQVHVDFHEMGYNSTYFFFPAVRPINPIYPEHILEWGERFGAGNAEAFDEAGWLYFTAESFDLFYPGYGDSWPSLSGAIGMTYEMAGSGAGGLAIRREDGTILTLADRALRHRTAGHATLRTAAQGKTDLLEGFAGFHRTVDEGQSDILLIPGEHPGRIRALVQLLLDQEIQVEQASRDFRGEGEPHPGFASRTSFPEGTFLVRARQPRGRLAMTLLNADTYLDAEFSYDITGWSLPFAVGVEAHTVPRVADAGWERVVALPQRTGAPAADARFGYLIRPSFEVAPAIVDFLEAGGRALVMADTFRLGGESYPSGTWFLSRERNDDLDRLTSQAGLGPHLIPIRTGLTERGPDLGTNGATPVELPRVMLLTGEGTTANSAGAHWFFLEQRLGIPFQRVNVADVVRTDLSEWDVIISPAGGVAQALGARGVEALITWVRNGGTLVAAGSSASGLGREVASIELREHPEEDLERGERLERALRTREERERDRWSESIPGTILQVELDPRHPLGFGSGADGTPGRMFVLSGGTAFEPDEEFESAAWFPGGVTRISGVISGDNLQRLDRSAWAVQKRLGGGSVILFADDPLFRMFWYSGFQPYTNALLLGPAF